MSNKQSDRKGEFKLHCTKRGEGGMLEGGGEEEANTKKVEAKQSKAGTVTVREQAEAGSQAQRIQYAGKQWIFMG